MLAHVCGTTAPHMRWAWGVSTWQSHIALLLDECCKYVLDDNYAWNGLCNSVWQSVPNWYGKSKLMLGVISPDIGRVFIPCVHFDPTSLEWLPA